MVDGIIGTDKTPFYIETFGISASPQRSDQLESLRLDNAIESISLRVFLQ